MPDQTTTADPESIRAIRNYAEAKNEGDLDAAMEPWHPDGRLHVVPLDHAIEGRDAIRAFFETVLDAVEDYDGILEVVHGDAHTVTVSWRLTGTLTGSILGIGPTGDSLDIPIVSLFEFDDDAIVEERLHLDLSTLTNTTAGTVPESDDDRTVDDAVDPQGFLDRFADTWTQPTPEEFADLFTEDGTLRHPTMDDAIDRPEIPGYVEQITSIVPDISLEVDNWAARNDTILIEWTITGTFDGEPVEWQGADRFTLRGDRAEAGVAYFDTMALWQRMSDDVPSGDLVTVALANE